MAKRFAERTVLDGTRRPILPDLICVRYELRKGRRQRRRTQSKHAYFFDFFVLGSTSENRSVGGSPVTYCLYGKCR
jgi:hypothetical protein